MTPCSPKSTHVHSRRLPPTEALTCPLPAAGAFFLPIFFACSACPHFLTPTQPPPPSQTTPTKTTTTTTMTTTSTIGDGSGYFGRLKQVGKPPEQRKLKVDTEASRRFIDSALASDSVWKNAKSSDPKAAQQKRAAAGPGRTVPAGQPEGPPSSNWISPESSAAPGSGKRKFAASSEQTLQSWQNPQSRQSGEGRPTMSGQGGEVPGATGGGPSPGAKRVKGGGVAGNGKKPARYHKW